jgi:hypothetical protein
MVSEAGGPHCFVVCKYNDQCIISIFAQSTTSLLGQIQSFFPYSSDIGCMLHMVNTRTFGHQEESLITGIKYPTLWMSFRGGWLLGM